MHFPVVTTTRPTSLQLPSSDQDRRIVPEDEELAAVAAETQRSINWRNVMLSARFGPARWQRQNAPGDFTVYTRQESHRYDVLAVGLVPGCVAEILNVLQSPTTEQFAQQLGEVFDRQLRGGEIVHRVHVNNNRCAPEDSELVDLTVNRVTFNKANWLANHEEWCYLDAIYRDHRGGQNNVVEKFMTTVQSSEILVDAEAATGKNAFHDVVCGYLLRAGEEDASTPSNQADAVHRPHSDSQQGVPSVTRVSFYAEFQIPKQVGFSFGTVSGGRRGWKRTAGASDKTIKERLLRLAESTSRLTTLVRRQRLGLQVLADKDRFLPPVNSPCTLCLRDLVVAKLCRVCGHSVCRDCSAKYERARQPQGSKAIQVTRVRVCADCMERVDQAEYTNLSASSLLGTHVIADRGGSKFSELLRDALLSSSTHKHSVKTIIRCMFDASSDSNSDTSEAPPLLQSSTPDIEFLEALGRLDLEQEAVEDVELRSDDHRSYQLDTSGSTAVPPPVPSDEEERLRVVNSMTRSALAEMMELQILCDLAARELGCAMTAISLIDRDEFFGVASNVPILRRAQIPRAQTLCAHTIMDKHTPLIVAHPEADIRFSKFNSIKEINARFYCAFPLIGENGQVIGTMCCFHNESIEITASQLVNLKKIAATASRLMRLQTYRGH